MFHNYQYIIYTYSLKQEDFNRSWYLIMIQQLQIKIIKKVGVMPVHVVYAIRRLCYPYWQYIDLFIFRFESLLCLRSTLRLFHLSYSIVCVMYVLYYVPVHVDQQKTHFCILINNYWMRLSMIARIIKAEVCVICRSQRLRRITQTEALIQ